MEEASLYPMVLGRLLLCLLVAASVLSAQDAPPPVEDESHLVDPASSGTTTRPAFLEQKTINWNGVLLQSGFFLSIEQGFRLWTEQGTRDGLKGPFIHNYLRSVGNLHGWADGDEFYVNYVGHPMQGSVAGYIFAQNDIPKYRFVEFGRNRDYWKSRLRDTAFSYAYSVQFEIGPISEASIGAIQSKRPQVGFVDHVVTPAIGMAWMIAEDALDKYVIKRVDEHIDNPYVKVFVRGWLNPSRSFANAMAFKVPWHRDTRPDLFNYDPQGEAVRRELRTRGTAGPVTMPVPSKSANALIAPLEFDLLFQPSYFTSHGGTPCLGGTGTAGLRLAPRWQALLDVGGCKLRGLDTNWSGDSLHYLAGVRYVPWASGRWSSSLRFLVGGEKLTHELMYPERYALLTAIWKSQGSDPDKAPTPDQYTYTSETNGFSLQGGLGLDYRINSALQLRVASVDYRHTWVPPLDGRNYANSLSFTTGLVLRMGSW